MTFKHKLSRRLAMLYASAASAAALAVAACELAIPLSDPGGDVVRLVIAPKTATVQANENVVFMSFGLTARGDTADISDVTWSATGGSLTSAGASPNGKRHYGHWKNSTCGGYGVTATAPRFGRSDTASIAVTCPVATVEVTPAAAALLVGQTAQLTAAPRDTSGNAVTGASVTWTSSNSGVATVSATGLVTGVAPGSATIAATSGGQTGNAVVTVTAPAPAPVATVAVSPAAASLQVGQTQQLTATPRDASGNTLTGRAVSWSSSNSSVASVNAGGLVTGAGAGAATITATSEGQSGTAAITVTAAPVPVASVTVSPATASVQVGQTVQLAATPRDASGNALSGRSVTWASSNTTVATVSAGGLVSGKAAGAATITAASEGRTGSASVTVTLAPVATVTVTPATAGIQTGQTQQFTATLKDAAGNTLAGRPVAWSSSNSAVAPVNATGLVSGAAAGSATITATSEGKSGTAAVTVTSSSSGPTLTLSGSQAAFNNTNVAAGTTIDARDASWVGTTQHAITAGGSRLTWIGGLVRGLFAKNAPYDPVIHDAYAMLWYGAPGVVIQDVRLHHYGDGISFDDGSSDGWTIRGVHGSVLRDDCVENDFGNAGLIDDSFFDGCYAGYSSRSYRSVPDNSGKVVTIRRSLFRLMDMPPQYLSQSGHSTFWKLDAGGRDPKLALSDNVFMLDSKPIDPSTSGNGYWLIPPGSRLASCSNNTIVWLGSGSFPDPVPACFTLTTDRAVWDAAVSAWKARHPNNVTEYPFP